MTLFDLVFIAVFLTTVAGLLTTLVTALLGHRASALRWLRMLGVVADREGPFFSFPRHYIIGQGPFYGLQSCTHHDMRPSGLTSD